MVTEGLPIRRRELDANKDIISGAEFLSIFFDASPGRRPTETTSNPFPTTVIEVDDYVVQIDPKSSSRPLRSTPLFAQTTTEEQLAISEKNSDSSESSSDGVILAVRISSSVGKTVSKEMPQLVQNIGMDETTTAEDTTLFPTTDITSRNFASEELPTIVAKSTKSELNVEVAEPITKDNSPSTAEFEESYPAKVEALPNPSHSSYDPTADFLSHGFSKSTTQPLHHTVIYHDQTDDAKGARSISYSSIIHALPQISAETEKPVQHERHERNYNGDPVSFVNNFGDTNERLKNDSRIFTPRAAPVTEAWQTSGKPQEVQITTERNWETQEKPYIPPAPEPNEPPKVYGRAEQNYEVDEAVSVESNGRTHGIQPSVPPRPKKKHDDNQKVGYVVEGRNYRKYRVEERTADGFIVGEYGVVSHNDGSLRGVRYTADGTINPRLISEALLKFLSL